jgi:hypothetical protein
MEPLTLAALAAGALYVARRLRKPMETPVATDKPAPPVTSKPPSAPQPSNLASLVVPLNSTGGSGDGLAWAATLPSGPSADRDAMILKAVQDGMARTEWVEIPVEAGGMRGTLPVMARTLRIGATNPVRVSVNYETAQKIADLLGAAMMTPHVADLTRLYSALPLAPKLQSNWVNDGSMAKTNRMIEYSKALDASVPVDSRALTSNEGKHWVVSARFWKDTDSAKRYPPNKRSANYGWWDKGAPNKRLIGNMWQPVGLAHDWKHVDYSQLLQFMSQMMTVEGVGKMHVGDVLADAKLSPLLSDEGPLASWAHPAFNKSRGVA